MKITIFNGNPDLEDNNLENYLAQLKNYLLLQGHSVNLIHLNTMDLNHCIGCFGCWIKQPGKCLIKDEHSIVCENYINSDFVIFASPLIMGFTSSLLKHAIDRLIPLLHYRIELVNKECHHVARYNKYPDIGVIVEKEADSDYEDLEIINNLYQRLALNFKAECLFTLSTETSLEEVCNEIITY